MEGFGLGAIDSTLNCGTPERKVRPGAATRFGFARWRSWSRWRFVAWPGRSCRRAAQDHAEAAGVADALNGRGGEHRHRGILDRRQGRCQVLVERAQVLALASLAPILEDHIGDAGVGQARAVVKRRDPGDVDEICTPGTLRAICATDASTRWVRSSEAPSGSCTDTNSSLDPRLAETRSECGSDHSPQPP